MDILERLKVCRGCGAGCFYYVGVADNPAIPRNVGRHLCGYADGGRYDSGAGARYIDELTDCPCGKWKGGAE